MSSNERTSDDLDLIEIALYWLFDLPINANLPESPEEFMQFYSSVLGQSVGKVAVRRELSSSFVRPGEEIEVTINISADDATQVFFFYDILPKSLNIKGKHFGLIKNLTRGSSHTFKYTVKVPNSSNTSFDIFGIAGGGPGIVSSISGNGKIDVISSSSTTVFELLAGSDLILTDIEFFSVVDLWVSNLPIPGTNGQTLSDQLFFQLIDAWITGRPIIAQKAKLPIVQLSLYSLANTLDVHAEGLNDLRLELFDLTGKGLLSVSSKSNRGHCTFIK